MDKRLIKQDENGKWWIRTSSSEKFFPEFYKLKPLNSDWRELTEREKEFYGK